MSPLFRCRCRSDCGFFPAVAVWLFIFYLEFHLRAVLKHMAVMKNALFVNIKLTCNVNFYAVCLINECIALIVITFYKLINDYRVSTFYKNTILSHYRIILFEY